MNPTLRLLTRADIAWADSLRAMAQWNQTTSDWERLIEDNLNGCFVAEWNSMPVGTATTTIYGRDLAWIGMVLVHPEYRRRGIGRALLGRCIDHLEKGGSRCIKLDATPAGRPVYAGLGFQDEWTLTRWEKSAGQAILQAKDQDVELVRGPRTSDLLQIDSLDAPIFGVSRSRLWRDWIARARAVAVVEGASGRLAAVGALRDGAKAFYLGPVTADSSDLALSIVGELLRRAGSAAVYWDIPDQIPAAAEWARRQGFIKQRALTRMFLGVNGTPGDPRRQFAIAGPEVG